MHCCGCPCRGIQPRDLATTPPRGHSWVFHEPRGVHVLFNFFSTGKFARPPIVGMIFLLKIAKLSGGNRPELVRATHARQPFLLGHQLLPTLLCKYMTWRLHNPP